MKIFKRIMYVLFVSSMLLNNNFAQNTGGINYQGLLIRENNTVVSNRSMTVKFSVYSGSNMSRVHYREYHEIRTTAAGFFNVVMGTGKIIAGDWLDIPWETMNIIVKVEVDTLKNGSYFVYQQTPIYTVPFAQFAQTSRSKDLLFDASGRAYYNIDSSMYIISALSKDTIVSLFPDGRIGVGLSNPKDGIELSVNKRLHLSSEEWHLDKSGVISMQALNDSAKPAISWFDEKGKIHAAMSTYDRQRIDSIHNREFAIETDDGKGNMLPRFTISYSKDWTDIKTTNSDFKVGDGGTLYVGKIEEPGSAYIYGNTFVERRIGIGRKNWTGTESFYTTNSVAELYSKNTEAGLMIRNEDGSHSAKINLVRGDSKWSISNTGNLVIAYNDSSKFAITPDGKVGIKTDTPKESLDVNGNVLVGGSVISNTSGYAVYFEVEGIVSVGDLVGVDPVNGAMRKYKAGDIFLGIACLNAGIISNYSEDKLGDPTWALICIKGEVEVNDTQIKLDGKKIKTLDNVVIGYRLHEGMIYIK